MKLTDDGNGSYIVLPNVEKIYRASGVTITLPAPTQRSAWSRRWEIFRVALRNSRTAHHRMMMRYLRKRGWVVFYTDAPLGACGARPGYCETPHLGYGECMMSLYAQGLKRHTNCK